MNEGVPGVHGADDERSGSPQAFEAASTPSSRPTGVDALVLEVDRALRVMFGVPSSAKPIPSPVGNGIQAGVQAASNPLSDAERRHAAGLMRVNHVGEVCAQALYRAQALATSDSLLKSEFESAAREEDEHLAWTAQRLDALRSHTSVLNPAWYAGAFALGWLAGKAGDRWSLSFVVETERQVERHLARHLERLPRGDDESRAIVARMRDDEIRHGQRAQTLGAAVLPQPFKWAMRAAAKLMTTTAYLV